MLEAIKENLEGLSEEEKKHYVERDNRFYLEVEPVGGTALEDVTGLKTTIGKLRTNESKLQKDLTVMQEKYEDIDPEEARNAIKKFDEVKNWDGDKKIEEAVEASKRELIKRHDKVKTGLEEELADAQTQLTDAIVDTKIVEALQKEEGNVELLIPHVKKHVRMVKNSAGKWYPEVMNDDGDPKVGDTDGTPMTIQQYIQEMKTQKTFAAGFPGANSTGSGGSGSSESGKQTNTGNAKTVVASDGKGMSSNIEDIASGKVSVDMSK